MGGELGITTTVGVGSIFRFTLPFATAAEGAAPPPSETASPLPLGKTGRALQILVAEDNRVNQMLVQSMLRKMGHSVEVADDGLAALNKVKAGTFDVVVMDMQMPVMDGEAATAAIRALPPPKRHIPVLALTADVMPEHRERYLAAGVSGLLAKPIDWLALSAELEAVGRASSSEAEP